MRNQTVVPADGIRKVHTPSRSLFQPQVTHKRPEPSSTCNCCMRGKPWSKYGNEGREEKINFKINHFQTNVQLSTKYTTDTTGCNELVAIYNAAFYEQWQLKNI